MANRYRLKGPVIQSRCWRSFPQQSEGPPCLLYNGYQGMTLTIHCIKRRIWRKNIALILLTLWAFMAYYRVNFTFYRLLSLWNKTRRIKNRKENSLLKLLCFWAATIVLYWKENKSFGVKSEKLRRQGSLFLDLSNELSYIGAFQYFLYLGSKSYSFRHIRIC
jgi:hypothetical protein